MRIAYVGDFARTWTTESHVADAIEALGHRVFRYGAKVGTWGGLFSLVDSEGIDVVFFSARPLVNDQREGGVEALRSRGVKTVSYHLDLFFGINRMVDVGRASWWKTDHVFTADGGAPTFFWHSQGVNHHWLPAAIPRAEIYRGEPDDRFRARVAFVGSKNYLPEWPYRRDLLAFLSKRYGESFRIFPEDGRRIHGDALNRLYASVDVVVGDTLSPGFVHGYYWSDRIYQTLGRGGTLVHPKIVGLGGEYRPGIDFDDYAFGDFIALGQKIDALLDEPRDPEPAMERTRELHTYEARALVMLERAMS